MTTSWPGFRTTLELHLSFDDDDEDDDGDEEIVEDVMVTATRRTRRRMKQILVENVTEWR